MVKRKTALTVLLVHIKLRQFSLQHLILFLFWKQWN